ncbi:MAG: hypothetical protein ABIR34_01405 [Marmoricola sp.]
MPWVLGDNPYWDSVSLKAAQPPGPAQALSALHCVSTSLWRLASPYDSTALCHLWRSCDWLQFADDMTTAGSAPEAHDMSLMLMNL